MALWGPSDTHMATPCSGTLQQAPAPDWASPRPVGKSFTLDSNRKLSPKWVSLSNEISAEDREVLSCPVSSWSVVLAVHVDPVSSLT